MISGYYKEKEGNKMSIRKRLLLSNIAIVIIPFIVMLLIEMLIALYLIKVIKIGTGEDFQDVFRTFHLVGLPIILIATNGLLTYFVARSVLRPVEKLSKSAEHISKGDFERPIQPMGNDELGKLAQTFESMRLKLKESADLQLKYEQNRKELIANISHDLKTPITSIKGYVEGIQDGIADTPEKMDRYIQTIYKKSMDMDFLIDELFLFSKLELNSVPFYFEKVDLVPYFQDLLEEIQYDVERNGIKISFIVEEGKNFSVSADREQLKRIAINIIQNSIKHMDKNHKEISVSLLLNLDEVVIQFKDNGKGIKKEAVPHIFEQFYRADSSRGSAEGSSGLGLAIAKRIIDQHGGRIWADSKIDVGTSIFYTLPKTVE